MGWAPLSVGSSARDRLRSRAEPTKAHVPVALSTVQQRVLDALREDGIALVRFEELFEHPGLWQDVKTDMEAFVEQAQAEVVADTQAGGKKAFLIRRFPHESGSAKPVLRTDSPWLEFGASNTVLDIVNSYRGVRTKLVDFDQWYTLPVTEGGDRVASQRWHRDPWDRHIVKVFLYFSDVDEESGPFEYVRQSTDGAKYGHLWPWGEEERYPPADELERLIPDEYRMLATAPAGTLVFCDTGGFHRGGYALGKSRILSVHTYVNRKITPETKDRRKFEVEWHGRRHLSEQARFALMSLTPAFIAVRETLEVASLMA